MKIFSKLVIASVLLAGTLSFSSPSYASDIVSGSALEKEMQAMIDQGILQGYGNDIYKPKENVTREQFAAFINRALNLPAGQHSFKDVPKDSTLSDEIGAVYASGIMQGVSDTAFKPTAVITREQMAQSLKNVLLFSEMELKEKRVDFVDSEEFVSSGGIRAVYNILHYGITTGIPIGDHGDLKFAPKSSTTREQAAAFIYRFLEAKELAETPPPVIEPPVTEPPVVEPPVTEPPVADTKYYLGYVEGGKLVKQEFGHQEYLAAAESFKNTPSADAIYKGDEIIRVKSGVVYSDQIAANKTGKNANIFLDSAFTKNVTYIEYGREIRYIDANDKFIKVQVGGTIGYVKHSEVDFVPRDLMVDQDYYLVNQWGTLTHHQYNYATKKAASYSIGPAPTGMAPNVKYYSADGVHFEAGSSKVKHYPYFQYQSIRTKTSYTADELDRYIMKRLGEVNNTTAVYKDALTKSKLIGTGETFIEMQNKYNVNALFMLAAAIHESRLGTSDNAQLKNNLFGIKVYDTAPEKGTAYGNVSESINDFARDYMNGKYVNPFGIYQNGAVPGNKTAGVNVKYASDPTWGAKVAGHMFRIDLDLGKKDIGKYQLGITNKPSTNVRNAPDGAMLYQFGRLNLGVNDAFGYPVVILGTAEGLYGYTWYKVASDLNPEQDKYNGIGWIRSDLVDIIK